MLSVAIITKNGANTIRRTLESVRFADEIVVLDSGSNDDTMAICKKYTAHVFSTDWPGFGKQKNRAISYTHGDWVLSLDDDEELTKELQVEIQEILKKPKYIAYTIPRHSTYLGKFIQYGDWHNDKPIRLFRKDKAQFNDAPVHEKLNIDGNIGHLTQFMNHYTFRNLDQVIDKMNQYSTLSAQQRFFEGKKGGIGKAILHASWSFIRGYLLRRGFLDGREGFLLAISNALGTFYRYVKLEYMG